MHLCLIEDTSVARFLPLTLLHPVYDLRCGVFTFRERILCHLHPSGLSLQAREHLVPLLAEDRSVTELGRINARQCMVVNGRCIMTAALARRLKRLPENTVCFAGEEFVAALLAGGSLDVLRKAMAGATFDTDLFRRLEKVQVAASLVQYPWDLIERNEDVLAVDMALTGRRRTGRTGIHRTAVLMGKADIHVGAGANIGAGSVIDATGGPVFIGPRAIIRPLSYIEGPAAIGQETVINPGARIIASTIGPVCKAGGEIQHSIMHSYVNKQHDGFLGHSYLSPWVNLGAGTTTSNLKNTYGNISVQVGPQKVDTGRMFLGLIAGDHLRTGINVPLDTGTIAGVSSNIFGASLPPKFIPSFSWGEAGRYETYDPARALEVASRAMSRRGIRVTEAYVRAFHHVFEETSRDRAGSRR